MVGSIWRAYWDCTGDCATIYIHDWTVEIGSDTRDNTPLISVADCSLAAVPAACNPSRAPTW